MQDRKGDQIMHKIIIDTDPGVDDAIAILLALAAKDEIEVVGDRKSVV